MRSPKIKKIIKVGLLIYFGIILLFGFLFWLTQSIKFSSNLDKSANLFDSIYFSFITFATIGYGDFLPTSTISKLLIFIETTTAIIFTPVFGGYLFYEILKRPKNILLPDIMFIRHINNNIVLSARVGNKGKPTTNNEATIEFYYIRNGTRWTKIRYKQSKPVLEEIWFVEIILNQPKNLSYLESLRFVYRHDEVSFMRLSISGNDIETGQSFYYYKDYPVKNIKYGGAYIHVVEWLSDNKMPVNWNNYNKIKKIDESQILEIKKLLDIENCN